jgi:4-aminobutyrate aminotransferase / (S)-3-amino-2-methylpropionate transaminase
MGEPTKLVLLEKVVEVIKKNNLVEKTKNIGKLMLDGLRQLESNYPNLVSNSRGLGTLCSFDMPNSSTRDHFIEMSISEGLHIGGCGESTIR